ncbi:hypothetical protein SEA_GODONK_28 [Gordonia phage GodonK]|uniref:Uncharacterized protein n=1 Tax=Gordonia phage GodonK TaxID=2562192 RepID=A0A4D6E207_9CAUD|nr:hypothetical protein HOV33_gp028 [Gordonia phage GodonK]QBZ72647.1 hypothetical protein SEA_GODONK_28 [Gordonia phage GodonK]
MPMWLGVYFFHHSKFSQTARPPAHNHRVGTTSMIHTTQRTVAAMHVMDCALTDRNGPGYENMGEEYQIWCACGATYYAYSTADVNRMIDFHLQQPFRWIDAGR